MSETASREYRRLMPAALLKDMCCSVFYDNHPMDKTKLDIIICTASGQLYEIYQMEVVSCTSLPTLTSPIGIKILRNNNCHLFYIVVAENEIFILSRKETPKILHQISYVERYYINDPNCTGQPYLKVFKIGDPLPLIFNEDLENVSDRVNLVGNISVNTKDSFPMTNHLHRKLIEARYNVYQSEKTYRSLLELHQLTAYSIAQNIQPNEEDSIFNKKFVEVAAMQLKILTETPWVKFFNNKMIIVFNLILTQKVNIENVHVLLHGNTEDSLKYTTRLFLEITTSPFWVETENNKLEARKKTALVVVIDMEEMHYNLKNRIDLSGVVSCIKEGKEQFYPFENISLSVQDIISTDYDLFSGNLEDPFTMLGILATSEKTTLLLRVIEDHSCFDLIDSFCCHLKMTKIPNTNNVIFHNVSRQHALDGMLIVFTDMSRKVRKKFIASVYSRKLSQVLFLIKLMHNVVPCKIIATPQNYAIVAKMKELEKFTENIPLDIFPMVNLKEYARSLVVKAGMIHKYLNACYAEMSVSSDPAVITKIKNDGIDFHACGLAKFLDFKKKLIDESMKCRDSLRHRDLCPEKVPLNFADCLPLGVASTSGLQTEFMS